MAWMRGTLPLTLSLLAPIAGCGGDDGSTDAAPRDGIGISLGGCGIEGPELHIGDLDGLYIGEVIDDGGYSGGVTIAGLNLDGPLFGGNIQITGYAATGEPEMVPRDGISIGLEPGPAPIDIVIPAPETCEELLVIEADGLPHHETGSFPNAEAPWAIVARPRTFQVPAMPAYPLNDNPLLPSRFDGVLFNGVPVLMREADCSESWCGAWHPNPMHEQALLGMDDHHGHVLSDGSYHYQADPRTLYDDSGAIGLTAIGVAADGHLIFGPWIDDGGVIRKVTPSYALRSGDRPADGSAPSGAYSGAYIEDYEFVADQGDLDVCNGMWLTDETGAPVLYGYFVTDEFPYLIRCLRGEPHASFDIVLP